MWRYQKGKRGLKGASGSCWTWGLEHPAGNHYLAGGKAAPGAPHTPSAVPKWGAVREGNALGTWELLGVQTTWLPEAKLTVSAHRTPRAQPSTLQLPGPTCRKGRGRHGSSQGSGDTLPAARSWKPDGLWGEAAEHSLKARRRFAKPKAVWGQGVRGCCGAPSKAHLRTSGERKSKQE